MIAKVTCNKCGADGKFDVGDITTIEEAQAKLDGAKIESCPFSNHIEMSPIQYTVTEIIEGSALTDEEAIAKLEEDGLRVVWLDPADLRADGIEITGFAFGYPMAKIGNEDFTLDMTTLPSGKRAYYSYRSEYERLSGKTEVTRTA